MKNVALVVILALVITAAGMGSAYAKDDFERGFRTELGAIAARSAVGVGVGIVNGVFGGGIAYNGYYARPVPVYRPYYRVYAPPPPPPPPPPPVYYRVETRYYGPYYAPPPPRPPVVYRYRCR